jgi:hypothetical protein
MKRLTLLIAFLITGATGVTAQNTIAEGYKKEMKDYPPRLAIKAGGGLANLSIDNAGTVNDKKAIPSWHLSLYGDLPLLPLFSVQGGIMLVKKGATFTIGDNNSNNYTEVSTRPLYLEIPVNGVVKFPLPNKVKLFAGAGPYLAFGIGGKNKLEGKALGLSFSDDKSITYNSSNNSSSFNSDLKRFDAGLNFLAGIEISHFTLNANYGYGLMNIKSGSDNSDVKYANRVMSLSVGVFL